MRVERLFTDSGDDILAQIPVRRVAVTPADPNQDPYEVTVPADWSQEAAGRRRA